MEKHKIQISNHAISRYMERTGTVFNGDVTNELRKLVHSGTRITAKEVILHDFPLTRRVKGDYYILFYANIPVVAVVSKDNTIKTVITKEMLPIARCYKNAKHVEYARRELKKDVLRV